MIGAQLDYPQNFRMKAFSQALLKFAFHGTYVKHSMQFFTKNLLITIQFFYYDFCGIIFDKN